jgi:TolB-like protein
VTHGVELAGALAGLHSRGLVHRDIKPSNVILVGGVAKLADIGLVAETSAALTYVGTEGFVPPEGPGKPAADVFALGRLLYEMATGLDRDEFPRLPAELNKVSDRKVLFGLNEIILRACEPDSTRRYPDAPALLADLAALEAGRSRRRGGRGRRSLALAAAVVAVAVTGLLFIRRPAAQPAPRPVTAGTAAPAGLPIPAVKSIAVLPFENLNDDKQDAFFADGIHEEILTDLANIASLRVISRTSVMPYRGTTKSIRNIAAELGVDYILEGSVRRVGQKVRVTGQLIKAAADEHLWARAFDGDMSDILGLQAQLATTIAGQLKAVLTPAEARRLTAFTLADPKAYDLYLRAKDLRRRDANNGGFGANPEAEALLQKATEIDPQFAPSWAELAKIYIESYFNDRNKPALRDLAKRAVDRALALAPDRAEPQVALADYYYYGFYDYENAALCLQKALSLEPSDASAHQQLGLVYRRLLRWRYSLAELRRAYEIDPRNVKIFEELKSTLSWTHSFLAAKELTLAHIELDPGATDYAADAAFFAANISLSSQPLDEWLAALTPDQRARPANKEAMLWLAFNSGQAERFLALVESGRSASSGPLDGSLAVELAISTITLGRDAADILGRNRAQLEATVKDHSGEYEWVALALNCALQKDRRRAETALEQATEVVQPDKDPVEGYLLEVERAEVLAWLGDQDAAIDLLSRLVRTPGPGLDPYVLKFSLDWWPLRGNSRFEALLADPATFHPKY